MRFVTWLTSIIAVVCIFWPIGYAVGIKADSFEGFIFGLGIGFLGGIIGQIWYASLPKEEK
jgi:hypothetical protein